MDAHSMHHAKTGAGPAPAGTVYTCPMHPDVRSDRPGFCSKCGMALEPVLGAGLGGPGTAQRTEWTCPMHPQIVQDQPGHCPICGMALEPRTVTLDEEENHELRDMTRRFWVSTVLAVPLVVLAMTMFLEENPFERFLSHRSWWRRAREPPPACSSATPKRSRSCARSTPWWWTRRAP